MSMGEGGMNAAGSTHWQVAWQPYPYECVAAPGIGV
jgi:hypothetical protein